MDHVLPPARITLELITEERVELYCAITSLRDKIFTSMTPAHVDDSVPIEEEVEWAVRRLWMHRSGGLSQMCTKHLQEWLW